MATVTDVKQWIKNAAAKYGVDENLALAVAKQESGFQPYVTSSAGAIGVMQLMPGTAKGLGVDPYNPKQNIDGGVRYLKAKLVEFGGNTDSALAAYNAGSGAVRKYNGVPPYKETQNYVKSIKSAMGSTSTGGGSLGTSIYDSFLFKSDEDKIGQTFLDDGSTSNGLTFEFKKIGFIVLIIIMIFVATLQLMPLKGGK